MSGTTDSRTTHLVAKLSHMYAVDIVVWISTNRSVDGAWLKALRVGFDRGGTYPLQWVRCFCAGAAVCSYLTLALALCAVATS